MPCLNNVHRYPTFDVFEKRLDELKSHSVIAHAALCRRSRVAAGERPHSQPCIVCSARFVTAAISSRSEDDDDDGQFSAYQQEVATA